MNDGHHAQFVDQHGSTLDVCADSAGISISVTQDPRDDFGTDIDVPYEQLTALIAVLLAGPDGEGMKGLSARYEAMFTPVPAQEKIAPQREVLWLASGFLHRLAEHRDHERWDEQDREDIDGMLREIISTAYAVRTMLLGEPDCPVPAHHAPHPPRRSITPARAEALQAARYNAMDAIPGRLAELRSQVAEERRKAPVRLAGCTCGGIGTSGAHRPACPWASQGPSCGLASCGHPANEDGECGCSWWPERAPHPDTL